MSEVEARPVIRDDGVDVVLLNPVADALEEADFRVLVDVFAEEHLDLAAVCFA
ncbi:hypothetical protein [Haloarcula halobia]|uniref:hypothetical protein n=1 Tax=Haloarcula halobia TaxID=3033388 RepID=UPI0023EB46FF|nr:hypothetical protein [Halomicroarcula sp. XH51]